MAAFLYDTFDEASITLLSSHTPNTGGTWAQHPNFTTNTISCGAGTGSAYGSADGGTAIYYNNATPPSADYYVECVVDRVSGAAYSSLMGPMGRVATGASTFYQAFFDDNLGRWYLEKLVAGTNTSLGTYTDTLTVGNPKTVRLSMNGSAIKLFVDGVERISATDTAITAAGFAGVRTRANGRLLTVTADTFVGSSIAAIANHYAKLRRT